MKTTTEPTTEPTAEYVKRRLGVRTATVTWTLHPYFTSHTFTVDIPEDVEYLDEFVNEAAADDQAEHARTCPAYYPRISAVVNDGTAIVIDFGDGTDA